MKNPYLREAKVHIGATGRKSERNVAKQLGARLTPASGAIAGYKSDMTLPTYQIEAKSSENYSFSLKYEWLIKITEEAIDHHKTPALTVTFTDSTGRPRRFGNWIMLPLEHYKELLERANGNDLP